MSEIDGIAFYGGAHTQQGFRKLILNLTGSEVTKLPQEQLLTTINGMTSLNPPGFNNWHKSHTCVPTFIGVHMILDMHTLRRSLIFSS